MSTRISPKAAFAALLFVGAVGAASAFDLQPGLWQTTFRFETAGATQARPPKTRCITPEMARDFVAQTPYENSKLGTVCKSSGFQQSGKTSSWRIHCSGKAQIDIDASLASDAAQHYTAVYKTAVNVDGKTFTSMLTVDARRTGECPK